LLVEALDTQLIDRELGGDARINFVTDVFLFLKLGKSGLNLRWVNHRDRALAVTAYRLLLQVDRRAAVGAMDRLHPFSQLVDLRRFEVSNDVFFAEELKERDEVAIVSRAAKVVEPGASLDVEGIHESLSAARARKDRWESERRASVGAHQPNQLQRGSGRELKVLLSVEPKPAARMAGIDLDLSAVISLDAVLLHGLPAAGAVH
jgi:hypothetical protein